MSRVLEVVAPARLGKGFRWLLASSWASNLGDGIALAAGPLLVASRTDEAFLVALAAFVQWAPPLLFGLYAGALTDRLDRRAIIVAVDLMRAVVLVLLAAAILFDVSPIALVLVAIFLLGTAEVFADNAANTLLPMLVHRATSRPATPGCRPASSPSTRWPVHRSGRPCSPRASPRRSWRRW